jgi:sugar phosphate isomerase/epimerase
MGLSIALDFRGAEYADSRSMLDLIGAVDHPSVRASFETGGYLSDNPGSNGEVALARVCGNMAHVRLSDHSGLDSDEEFPPLGEAGGVDFARTLEILSNIGFDGPCVIQLEPRHAKRCSLARWREWLEQSVSHLHRCGWPSGG